ncbi:ABC transporter permease [Micromonospora ureilytica]|uniref:ABC transporter permease n=1 Tax=Micromonospora ureilytica TaxID=709868 RepID=A0A3N9XW93_9ACTN|nr:ABC transporter permease [Micromonospora ureilytica]MBG6064950.1 ABC-type transport system involved in multi-copper enzyme maturation permease subunit [Micromonospora ureilytica]RQX17154.1 ABC transporter permease [Micromonospora ureilytica]WSR55406.1 ABC transporter permease [Micromonospora ureilytica]
MIALVAAEIRRLQSTRLWLWALVAALACGGGLVGLIVLIGPHNAQPPMPGLETPDGVRSVLGIVTVTVLVPAVLGTIAMTSEYRHRTISTTFLFAPRRWRILTAKLIAFALGGTGYGLTVAISAGLALYGIAALQGIPIGLGTATVVELLLRLVVTMAIYTVLGVGIGALLRNQVAALAVVVGYLYFIELAILAIPGVSTVYPILPGGATASLTNFGYLTDAMAQQTGQPSGQLLSTPVGALVLAGYALLAATLAVAFPLRRDIT